ncbi:hypothetical protein ES705_18263 [subsurface metagenome]
MNTNLYIGTSGWTYDHWKGLFYPSDLPKSRWFDFYKTQYNTVEINATFYRFFQEKTYLKWKEQVDESFRYVLKIPRLITHRKRLINVQNDLKEFYSSACLLENNLGLLLLQLPPYEHKNFYKLETSVSQLSFKNQLAIEFRHMSWYDKEVVDWCEKNNIIFCNVESEKINLTNYLTNETGYFRLHGKKGGYRYNYSEEELGYLARQIQKMQDSGAKSIYVFFNNDYDGYAPRNAISLKNIF